MSQDLNNDIESQFIVIDSDIDQNDSNEEKNNAH